jgi:hypothetical protein
MGKAKILICIGTMGRSTFNRCYESVLKAQKAFSEKTDLHIIKNKSPQSEWLNAMRKAAMGWDWCFQVDEDMYLYENAFEYLYHFAKRRSRTENILNASSMLYDLFLEQKIGSFKIWNSDSLRKLKFKNVLGSDRDIAKRAEYLKLYCISKNIILGDHDSAPNEKIAYNKYYKYVDKLKKFNNTKGVDHILDFLDKKRTNGCKISEAAYRGAFDSSVANGVIDNSNCKWG